MAATLIDCGIIRRSGRIIDPSGSTINGVTDTENGRCFQLGSISSSIYLNQKDIRQVQLAKGAICLERQDQLYRQYIACRSAVIDDFRRIDGELPGQIKKCGIF